MSHARQQVREAVATLLKVSPVTWGLVFETRIPPSRAVMPYLLVFSDGEAVDSLTVNMAGIYFRDLSLAVAGRLRLPGNNDTETIEDRMDALAAEVESRLMELRDLTSGNFQSEVCGARPLALPW